MPARLAPLVLLATLTASAAVGCATPREPPRTVRFATFNASLNRAAEGQLVRDLSSRDDAQARNVAEVIQRVRPDVLLINEFDFDPDGRAAELFQQNYLAVAQNGAEPIRYAYAYVPETNTGVPSGHDLDNDGRVVTTPGTRGYGNDCFGYGEFPGQYGFVLYSRFPIREGGIVTFGEVLWKDLPGAMLPRNADGTPWYSDAELQVMRLSSKNHCSVPLVIERDPNIFVLLSHPTPPAFDGPEDRNGKRNHDEIRLWSDRAGKYDAFVVMGDLNADPNDGGSVPNAIRQLLDHPNVNATFIPRSDGAAEAAQRDGGRNANHRSPSEFDTADFSDTGNGPGNLRVDYVLPSKNLKVIGGGVFWPASSDPLHRLVQMKPVVATSDHRLVWLDVQLP